MSTETNKLNAHQLLEWILACNSRDQIYAAIRAWQRANPRSPGEQALSQYYGYDANIVGPVLDELADVARRIVRESGPGAADTFDARQWIDEWAHQPLLALNRQRPVHLLHTAQGVARVRLLLEQIQYGVYV